ncbi:substrate-binding domain-containing protein [Sphingosinicella sp. LY1275]|uniref:substrate-binding domain-containing protein n=1 Tax=Sphingosinicella sp. LY1275 TaxID=3095379 RepID=UPI002ADED2E9|nr:substrate-binding domain-containing protein [Sphingosinicella sp. LY1275]MEA1014634.1 substrate-binding domain-containing protein [Sphingosinicella sp. LY1275]
MEANLTKSILTAAVAALALTACGQGGGAGGEGGARQQIRVVGSSTVYPFTTAVAERFAQANPSFKAPIVESTGTGAGMKLFCAGVGAQHPDVANASRRIKKSELEDCAKNGVNKVVEVQVGIDGLAFIEANSAQPMKLTVEDVYKAIAANPYGKPNTAKTWKDVNPALPAVKIQVYGPPPTSGTRDALAEMILEKGCTADAAMKELKKTDEDKYKDVCTKVREDGVYVEAGENDNLLVQKVSANPGSVGVMGYSFLDENADKVRGIPLGGVTPTYETISTFDYPGARPLYIYVKGEHVGVIPGLKEFLAEYAKGWGDKGYLVQRGLIASPADAQASAAAAATALTPVDAAQLK